MRVFPRLQCAGELDAARSQLAHLVVHLQSGNSAGGFVRTSAVMSGPRKHRRGDFSQLDGSLGPALARAYRALETVERRALLTLGFWTKLPDGTIRAGRVQDRLDTVAGRCNSLAFAPNNTRFADEVVDGARTAITDLNDASNALRSAAWKRLGYGAGALVLLGVPTVGAGLSVLRGFL